MVSGEHLYLVLFLILMCIHVGSSNTFEPILHFIMNIERGKICLRRTRCLHANEAINSQDTSAILNFIGVLHERD